MITGYTPRILHVLKYLFFYSQNDRSLTEDELEDIVDLDSENSSDWKICQKCNKKHYIVLLNLIGISVNNLFCLLKTYLAEYDLKLFLQH